MVLQTALAFLVLLLVVVAMAVGVMLTGRRIKGSCGGLSAIPGLDRCDLCGRDMRDPSQSECGERTS